MNQGPYRASRRRFVLGTVAAAGALVVGWSLLPPRQRLHDTPPASLPEQTFPLNGWVMVSADGRVTLMLARSEMGQGVMTSLAMLVAEELDVPLSAIDFMQAPIRKIYGDVTIAAEGLPFHPEDHGLFKRGVQWMTRKAMREVGVMVTGGSSSVRDSWQPLREAGAAARARLLAAAAQTWTVPVEACTTRAGRVLHASGQSASYGELAERAAAIGDVPYQLKEAAQFKLIGLPVHRVDTPSKVNGSARFGMDIRLPGMRYAMVAMCPVFGGKLQGFDAGSVQSMTGVERVVALKADRSGAQDTVAVIADTRWHAIQAIAKLSVTWDEGPAAQVSSEAITESLRQSLDQESGFTYYRRGDVSALQRAKRLNADYQAPFLAHAAMEPVNCTALYEHGKLKLWVPTQSPSVAVTVAARAADVDSDDIDLQVTMLGGGFGRRLDNDMVAQVAQLARAMEGQPVQLLWTREQDLAHDFYRPAAVARMQGTLDADGRLIGWETSSAGGSPVQPMLKRAFGLPMAGPDKATVEGLYDHPYEIPNQRVSHVIVDSEVPLGSWRSVGHSHNAFFKESFIDELAHEAGVDAIEFRRHLLDAHPRHLAVLDAAVELAGVAGKDRALGVALHESFGTIVAQVAEVSVDGSAIRVHRISCAVDCGMVVNPDGVMQQVESSVALGLSAALHSEIVVSEGRAQVSNFHDYPILRIGEMPEVKVVMLPSTEPPSGMGEPALPPVAPAVANAVFKLTGQRLRSLPLRIPV
jgi:isoquinoline 1-oxidoreductase beta subunit